MASKSTIEWTEYTWNPITGCTKISLGCQNCYAERMAKRLKAMGQPNYRNGFDLAWHEDALDIPLHWRKPSVIFVNSMSDLFHEDVPFEFILKAFKIMGEADHHIFQVLTKRSKRLRELSPLLPWTENIWMGVTVEHRNYVDRIDDLRSTNARTKFLSLEPLLSGLPCLDLDRIDWVITGGESGPNSRPMNLSWVTDIRDQCAKAHVPFFFKQWGGINKKKAGRELEGRTWDERPGN